MTESAARLLKGTVDVMILKAVSWAPLHGYAISRWIAQTTGGVFTVQEGALYPALRRLEQKGLLESYWAVTETGREARFYRLTRPGKRLLDRETQEWARYADAMSRVLESSKPA